MMQTRITRKGKKRKNSYARVRFSNVFILYHTLLIRDNIIPCLQVQFSIKKLYISFEMYTSLMLVNLVHLRIFGARACIR
jgi:hypothetical protein